MTMADNRSSYTFSFFCTQHSTVLQLLPHAISSSCTFFHFFGYRMMQIAPFHGKENKAQL